jgi:glutaredoxin|tara:strand:- start:55 stop:282 length:228 start_codon:yes stop_codon:yes gene_type:complete
MKFTIITQMNCKYCTKAAQLLDDAGLDWESYPLADAHVIRTLFSMTNLTTVPQIFHPDGTLIGGYENLRAYLGRT